MSRRSHQSESPVFLTREIDIFGFCPQTLQEADILAYSNNNHPFQVIVPDFFNGGPADPSWFILTANPSDQAKIEVFIETHATSTLTLKRIPGIVNDTTNTKGVTEWGALRLCLGGKVVTNLSTNEGVMGWKAAAQTHPSILESDDVNENQNPLCRFG